MPQIYSTLFDERYEWVKGATSFDDRTNIRFRDVQSVFTAPDGALGWVIASSVLLGALLIVEVMIAMNSRLIDTLEERVHLLDDSKSMM